MTSQEKELWYSLIQEYKFLFNSFTFRKGTQLNENIKDIKTRINISLDNNEFSLLKDHSKKPICQYLNSVIENNNHPLYQSFFNILTQLKDDLSWEYGYDEISEELKNKFAYTEVLGPEGPLISEDIILGMVLLAPDCHYPEHKHENIAETYLIISGDLIVNDQSLYTEGSLIHNSPGKLHELSTLDKPCLLAYAWTGDKETLNNYTMEFD